MKVKFVGNDNGLYVGALGKHFTRGEWVEVFKEEYDYLKKKHSGVFEFDNEGEVEDVDSGVKERLKKKRSKLS